MDNEHVHRYTPWIWTSRSGEMPNCSSRYCQSNSPVGGEQGTPLILTHWFIDKQLVIMLVTSLDLSTSLPRCSTYIDWRSDNGSRAINRMIGMSTASHLLVFFLSNIAGRTLLWPSVHVMVPLLIGTWIPSTPMVRSRSMVGGMLVVGDKGGNSGTWGPDHRTCKIMLHEWMDRIMKNRIEAEPSIKVPCYTCGSDWDM